MTRQTRGQRNAQWIEKYCVVPSGPDKGRFVHLTPAQRETVHQIYNHDGPQPEITAPMSAYLVLLHVCGPEALQKDFRPAVAPDLFSLWAATGPGLKEVLQHDGERIVCPELGTYYPVAA